MADDQVLVLEAKTVISDESDAEKKHRGSVAVQLETAAKVILPSPAPVSVPGGEDDIFTVSAVRKIKVTEPPVPTDSKATAYTTTVRVSGTTPRDNMPTDRNDYDDDSESSDDEFESDSEPMEVIEKSPYEIHQDAEKGEPLFTRMKEILKEENHGDTNYNRGKVSEEAKEIFGASNSWDMIRANSLIQKSGMVYSQEWTEGMIRGERIGTPKELILLCLSSNRLSKQGDPLLSGLTRDFGVSSIVAEGLKQFKFAKKYPRIMSVTKNYQFFKRRRDCYKAAIFVARAYGCYKAFGNQGELAPNLKLKILACLDMMEANLRGEDTKKKLPSTDIVAKTSPDHVPSLTSGIVEPPKRKRGRPRKNPRPETGNLQDNAADDNLVLENEDDSILDTPVAAAKKKKRKSASEALRKGALAEESFDDGDDDDNMYPYNPPSRGRAGKVKSSSTAYDESTRTKKAVTSSLSNLVSVFEQQYLEMGKVYRKMGETLHELKSKIQENRTATEEELRAEILLEVQDSLLKSFGKSS